MRSPFKGSNYNTSMAFKEVSSTFKTAFQMTRKSTLTMFSFLVIFGALLSLFIVPSSFLVAIASIGDPSNPSLFFWVSLLILLMISITSGYMLFGMLLYIGHHSGNGTTTRFEDTLKHPLSDGRFKSYAILGMVSTIIYFGLGRIIDVTLSRIGFYDIGVNLLLDISITVVLALLASILFNVFLITGLSIANDDAESNAFIFGWKTFLSRPIEFLRSFFIGLIPLLVAVFFIVIAGLSYEFIPTGNEQLELTLILSLSFGIVILSFMIAFLLLPFLLNVVSREYFAKNKKVSV